MAEGEVQERRDALRRTVQEAFAAEDLGTLRLILNDHHPADLANLFRHLDDEEQPVALQTLAEPLAAAVLAEMDADVLREVAEDIPADDLSGLVDEMAPDDAADVLGDLSEEQSAEVLDLLEGEEAGQVRELLAHPEDTAGGLMPSRFMSSKRRPPRICTRWRPFPQRSARIARLRVWCVCVCRGCWFAWEALCSRAR